MKMMKNLQQTMSAMRAAAEPTRLRILALCAQCELTVSDLVRILGQSQPRISRHLKVLTAADLLTRVPEGGWVFYRLDPVPPVTRDQTEFAPRNVAHCFITLAPKTDEMLRGDQARLEEIKAERAQAAAEYFKENASNWDSLRSLHVDEAEVERVILSLIPEDGAERLLDLGTGTGRMLELLADRVDSAEGIDKSREMLAIARANLEKAGFNHCQVRQGDLNQIPFQPESADLIIIHQVLHFLTAPGDAIQAAANALRPGGRMIVVDFAPHEEESLRREHQHRRLGFSDTEAQEWFRAARLTPSTTLHLPGSPLTVAVWSAEKPQDELVRRARRRKPTTALNPAIPQSLETRT